MGSGDYVVECYGLGNFLADIDAGREYWRGSPTFVRSAEGADDGIPWCGHDGGIVGAILSHMAGEGLAGFFARHSPNIEWKTPQQFRQRHMLRAIDHLRQVIEKSRGAF